VVLHRFYAYTTYDKDEYERQNTTKNNKRTHDIAAPIVVNSWILV
jgi:hypothetical protein